MNLKNRNLSRPLLHKKSIVFLNIDVYKRQVHESGAFAVAMDIDAAGLPFLKNLDPPAGSKTVSELCDIIQMAGTPSVSYTHLL